jgi:cephalosporin hydroxylase
MGHPIEQLPLDMWLYQELIYRERPPFILQTGIRFGGSLLYFAHLLDLMGADPGAIVIGVDIELTDKAREIEHPRIRMIQGSSTDPDVLRQIEELLPAPTGFVSLDSDHRRDHVLRELELYHRFVGVGNHLVVEDTNINGHPVFSSHGPGPFEATSAFLRKNKNFIRHDAVWRRNLYSHHQYGWLLRIK